MKALVIGFLVLLSMGILTRAQASDNDYVGSKACYGCHSQIYQSFKQTDMGRSMTVASEWQAGFLPAGATVAEPGTSHIFSVSRGQSGWRQSESEPGIFSVDHALTYAVGTGSNGVTFLVRRGNFLFQAPLSFYSRANKWDLSPGYENVDLGFTRKVPEQCINCHAGRAAPLINGSGAYADPPFQELAIGCENCHGPGGRHARSAGKAAGAIVNPERLTPRLADNICLNCHQRGDARVTQPGKTYLDFRPGQWLYDTAVIFNQPADPADPQSDLLQHFSAMQASHCFRATAGKLSCLTCHDPHVQPRKEEVAAYFRLKCLTCHGERNCRLPFAVRAAKNPPDDCAGCHMPKRDVAEISHSALTNHRIPARSDEQFTPPQQNVIDGLVVVNPAGEGTPHLSKLILLHAYQQLAPKSFDYQHRYLTTLEALDKSQPQDSYVQAALGDRALLDGRTEDAVSHLRLALTLGNPGVYLELAQGLAKLGRSQEAVEYLKKGVDIDPYNATMQKTLILQYINLKSYTEARALMQQYVADFPADSFMRSLLARVSK